MTAHDTQDTITHGLDRAYLVETLSQLARVPTDVPLGFDTLIEPDDPKLVHFVQDVVRPELAALGIASRERLPRLEEGITLLRRFWGSDPVTFEGEVYRYA